MAAPLYAARPPSAWVRDKTPDHDRYQGWLMQLLRGSRGGMLPSFLKRSMYPDDKIALLRRNTQEYRIEAEFEFLREGFVFAFADILEQRLSKTGTRTVTIWEIKPKIESVFGTIRQIKYYRHLAQERFPEADYLRFVVACQPDDPLSGLMRREWKSTVPLGWGWTKHKQKPEAVRSTISALTMSGRLAGWARFDQTSVSFPTDVAQATAQDVVRAFQIVTSDAGNARPKALRLLLGRPEVCRWFSDQGCLNAAREAWWECFGAPLRQERRDA